MPNDHVYSASKQIRKTYNMLAFSVSMQFLPTHRIVKEPTSMSEAKDKTIARNVCLKPSESSAHPRATNYTDVGVARPLAPET